MFGKMMMGILFAIGLANSSVAADDGQILISDSAKETEVTIVQLLKEKLGLDANLKLVDSEKQDMRVQVIFGANEILKTPQIVLLIDTRILARDKHDAPKSQVISLISYVGKSMQPDKELELLKWTNSWNGKSLPIRFYVSGGQLVAALHLAVYDIAPLSEESFVRSVVSVVQIWPVVIKDLESQGLM